MDREDYIKEVEKQLRDEKLYEEDSNDVASLLKTINEVIAKIRQRGDLKKENLDYFIMKGFISYVEFIKGYIIPRYTSNILSGYSTENIFSFLDHHLQPPAQAVKSYIKETNEFLKKLRSLLKLPDGIILCTIDVAGLYPNIPHTDGLSALRKRLETRKEKYISTDIIIDLAEVMLKSNMFTFGRKTLK